MEDIVPKNQIRHQRAKQRVGSNSNCVICGESDPRVIELHHIAGQHFHGELTPVCRNCHRKLSDGQRDHPPQVANPPLWLEVVGHYLLGLADMLRLVANTLVEFARRLIGMAAPDAEKTQ
ncbi:MAG: hypothetical protein QM773_05545 [Hyphomonadaceae bacterium]